MRSTAVPLPRIRVAANSARRTRSFLPGLPGFEDAAIFPLGGPDLATARRLAGDVQRRAVLYTCNLPGCSRHAQILRSNLRAIGIELDVRQFSVAEMFTRINESPDEPFDIAYYNWFYDNADPANYINLPFGPGGPNERPFENREFDRRMADAAKLQRHGPLPRLCRARPRPLRPLRGGGAVRDRHQLISRLAAHGLRQAASPVFGLDLAEPVHRGSG